MKKQIIIELDQKDDLYRVTISTPQYQRFDLYCEVHQDLNKLLEIVSQDITSEFLKDYFKDLGFSYDMDKLEQEKIKQTK